MTDMPTLSVASAVRVLMSHGLLREIIHQDLWTLDPNEIPGSTTPFTALTYDTRTVTPGSLLFIKGRFHDQYLTNIDNQGLAAYVSETDKSAYTNAPGLIVNNVRQAMSLLAAEYYNHPEKDLTLIGITGTKGKTTTTYLTHAILNTYSHGHAAMFSSTTNCLDGHTRQEAQLTTPESLDAMHMMRQAVNNNMRYLVMEVSSQAYKTHRVYGLTFDIAAFLNITPDHISDIEHPTYEDYLNCKRQITHNTRHLILNTTTNHHHLIHQDATQYHTTITEYTTTHTPPPTTNTTTSTTDTTNTTNATSANTPVNHPQLVTAHITTTNTLTITVNNQPTTTLTLDMPGDFNASNATAAIAIAINAGIPADHPAIHAIEHTHVPGRMETLTDPTTNTTVIVDYAHNHASVAALLDYIDHQYPNHPHTTLVTGAAGNKAYNRRQEIVQTAQKRISRFVFTAEDTDTEPFIDICNDMLRYVTEPDVQTTVIEDRTEAVRAAIFDARQHPERTDIVLLIGKGEERWIKNLGHHTDYAGDDHVAKQALTEPLNEQ